MRMTVKYKARGDRKESGFTLVEMCICLIIIGFLMIPFAQSYTNSQKTQKIEKTRANVKQAGSEISNFVSFGRLPCPSNRSIGPGNANYGRELGLAAGVEPTAAAVAAIPVCTGGMQGICRTAGTRDTNADPDTLPDPVIIGGVPVQSLRDGAAALTAEQSVDGWGNQLTYAVSARLCQSPADPTNSTQMHKRGVIRAIDENGNPTAGISTRDLSDPADGTLDDDGQFVLLSHGEAGVGAYSENGSVVSNCTPLIREGENCDNDSTFMSAISNSKGDNNNYFDDITYFHLRIENSLWNTVSYMDGAGIAVATDDIRNLNDNNVGVLTDSPQEKLHVNGDALADAASTPEICNRAGDFCFDFDFLRDRRLANVIDPDNPTAPPKKRNTCAAGEIILTIGDNTVTCGRPALQAPGVARRCADTDPTRPYLRGITSDGALICTN